MAENNCLQYIGKIKKLDNGELKYHLLVYHSLDVAAVAKEYLNQRSNFTSFYTKIFGFKSKRDFINFILFFIALHDLGKFSITFQNILPEIWDAFPDIKPDEKIGKYKYRHDTLGYQYWYKELRKRFKKDLKLKGIADWIGVVTGHHGKPPEQSDNFPIKLFFHERDCKAIDEWINYLYLKFLKNVDYLPTIENSSFKSNSKTFSWWLAGITVLADWLGSNASYFEYTAQKSELSDYWNISQKSAQKAVYESGLCQANPSSRIPFNEFFNFIPTPLQSKVSEIHLNKGPQLFILEDVTGSGKTEAAIYLTHRLISAKYAEGLFFALPTKATTDAIYTRVGEYYHKLYDKEDRPSFMLSHGSRNLNKDFTKSILERKNKNEIDPETNNESASTYCNAWLADNQKTALLAEIGIGTIDQTLIGVLPQRHQSLRLLGLFNKVLVIDEVHSYDPYMNVLLCRLIRFQASIGSSTILMSATIPQSLKQCFVDAFCDGTGTGELKLISEDFPLFTHVNTEINKPVETGINTRSEVKRAVKVNLIHKEPEIYKLIVDKIQEGHCVCWIRNTVSDVQSAYAALSEYITDLDTTKYPVFHSRFCLGDRLDMEKDIIARFGKKGDKDTRSGRLLIATQVIEQSLDVDFDVLISDLAPIDAIIQRAGRLQRHVRNDEGMVQSESGFIDKREPVLYVFSPDPINDPPEDWYSSFFPKSQWVYRNDNQLWRTAKKLKESGVLQMPENARELVEHVYSASLYDIQPNLMERTLEEEGTKIAGKNIAEHFALNQQTGYLNSKNWDETNILTRLGLDTTNVYLAKWENNSLHPWYDHKRWEYSQLRAPGTTLPKTFEIEDRQLRKAVDGIKESFREKKPLILPFVKTEKGWFITVKIKKDIKEFTYDPKFGFCELNFGS